MQKILVFAKEFSRGEPISEFSLSLAERISSTRGMGVDLVCFGGKELPERRETFLGGKLTIHFVPFLLDADTFFNWVLLMNSELKRKGRQLAETTDYVMIVGNDWTTSPAASSIAALFNIPFVFVAHSTEQNRGFSYENSRPISDLEWEACFVAKRVLPITNDCRNSLVYDLKVPREKLLTLEGFFDYVSLLEEVSKQA